MRRLALLISLSLALGGCVLQPPRAPQTEPSAVQRTHPRYAPPPAVKSHWNPALGVYVVEGVNDLYYRERVFYRYADGWSWSPRPGGPWQSIDSTGVPPGLYRHYLSR